jgi:hypothetical protein
MQQIILCKVTSRNRPNELIKCICTYLTYASNPVKLKWLFTFDENDAAYNNPTFLRLLSCIIPTAIVCFGKSNNKIHAFNRDINNCDALGQWDIIISISDDQLAEVTGWDDMIRAVMPLDLDASIWAYDGDQKNHNTMEIVGRTYYERFGYLYHPDYLTSSCDIEATEVAQKLGKQVLIDRCIIKHYNPLYYAGQSHMNAADETYHLGDGNHIADRATYLRRKAAGFP